jgi:hypothetical protein
MNTSTFFYGKTQWSRTNDLPFYKTDIVGNLNSVDVGKVDLSVAIK